MPDIRNHREVQPAVNEAAVQFYIPATSSLAERRPRILKHDDLFGMFDHYGDFVGGEQNPEGLYHQDTRFLSMFILEIGGIRPLLLSSTVQNNNAVLNADLTNGDIYREGRLILPRDTIHVSRSKFLWKSVCYERLAVRNFDDQSHEVLLEFMFDADFTDLFEVRGHKRLKRGKRVVRTREGNTAAFSYTGLDSTVRWTNIRFEPKPDEILAHRAVYRMRIGPGERKSIFVTVSCSSGFADKRRHQRFFSSIRKARKSLLVRTRRAATVETSNDIFNELLCRSMADLTMLITDTKHGPYPYAGTPWFSTAFGRDGIITAIEMLWIDPEIARGVLEFLAETQATSHDPQADAEPGKILHETRNGEMARLGEVPFGLYYGSIDATPLFVVLAGMYFERTGDRKTIAKLWPNIESALRWIDQYGDRDGDGYIEYSRQHESGLVNQGWKDSHDSVFHADGRLADGPIALCEVQGYVYAAKRYGAIIALELKKTTTAASLEQAADQLRRQFEDDFWCDELSTYALALDGEKRPCRIKSSNAGQVLFSGIADAERAALVADGLLGGDMFSGWGIRTLSTSEARYNPMSYHNGSVWPHDNALIGIGLARYGHTEHAMKVFSALFAAATYMDLRRLPELFCGFRRRLAKGPVLYPVACSPQAWASAAPFALLQACLGVQFDPVAGNIHLRHPRLPDFLDHAVIRSLRLGDTVIDVMLHRHETGVAVNVLGKSGEGRFEVVF